MRSRAELIELSGIIDTSAEYCSFYEFAVNYLFNMKEKKKTETEFFFESIKKIGDNSDNSANYSALGKASDDSGKVIKRWCTMLLNNKKVLNDLSVEELHYVMGYCARRAKCVKG